MEEFSNIDLAENFIDQHFLDQHYFDNKEYWLYSET